MKQSKAGVMWERLQGLMAGFRQNETEETETEVEDEETRRAVAGLLATAALSDGTVDSSEDEHIRAALQNLFGYDEEEARQLTAEAHRAAEEALDLFQFTRIIVKRYPVEERTHLLQSLWEVVYADGQLDHHETALMRRLSGLLCVPDITAGTARKRAAAAREEDSTNGS